jgi:hypothetical protein
MPERSDLMEASLKELSRILEWLDETGLLY